MSGRTTVISLPTIDGTKSATGYAAYVVSPSNVPETSLVRLQVDRDPGADTSAPTATVTTLSPGFVLYFPYSVATATAVTWPTLLAELGSVYPGPPITTTAALPAFVSIRPDSAPLRSSIFSFGAEGGAIWVPVTNILDQTVDMNSGIAVLRNVASRATPTTAPTSDISSASTSNSATSTSVENTLTTPPIISPTITPDPDDNESPSTATLAGGIVGGILAAVLLCGLLGFFLIRRKRSKRSAQASEEGNKNAPGSKSGMTGSQKQKMDNTNPLVIEVADSSAVPISDLWLAPKGNRTRWWHFGREGGR